MPEDEGAFRCHVRTTLVIGPSFSGRQMYTLASPPLKTWLGTRGCTDDDRNGLCFSISSFKTLCSNNTLKNHGRDFFTVYKCVTTTFSWIWQLLSLSFAEHCSYKIKLAYCP